MHSRLLLALLGSISIPFLSAQAQDAGGGSPLELKDDSNLNKGDIDVKIEDDGPSLKLDPNAPDAVVPARPESSDPAALLNDTADSERAVLEKLSDEDRKRLAVLIRDASTFVSGIRIQEAMERLLEAEAIAPELFTVHNLMGAAFTKIRDFPKARERFTKAVELAPRAFMARFNLTEIDFVEGKHADAIAGFTPLIGKLKEEIASLEAAANDPRKPFTDDERKGLKLRAESTKSTIKLIEFKLLICQLKLGNTAEAQKILGTFNFLEDTPGFYYGHAAIAYNEDDEEKAQEWLRSAERIYSRPILEIYTDSLIETGWIENLQ